MRLTLYDLLGHEIAVLVNKTLPAGRHEATFAAGDRPGGLYYYRLETGERVLTRPMVLLK